MNHTKLLQEVLKGLGYYTGRVDGRWGEKSIKGYNTLTRDMLVNGAEICKQTSTPYSLGSSPILLLNKDGTLPKEARIPSYSDTMMNNHFGNIGDNIIRVELPYPMVIAWDTSVVITSCAVHALVGSSLVGALREVLAVYGLEKIKLLGLDQFGGVLNVRKMRGGDKWSSHAWGCAIDINPLGSPFRSKALDTVFSSPEYTEFARIMVDHGFGTLEYDLMHWQYKI